MKKSVLMIIVGMCIISVVGCGKADNSMAGEETIATVAADGTGNKDDLSSYSDYESIENATNKDVKETLTKIKESGEILGKSITSYSSYDSNKDNVTNWYKESVDTANQLYERICKGTYAYYYLIAKNGLSEYTTWNGALGDAYDMWNDNISDVYDQLNESFNDLYDICNEAIYSDDKPEYSIYSKAWKDMYETYSDRWKEMYDDYSDNWSDFYKEYSDVYSGFYKGNTDLSSMLKKK